MYYWPLKKRSWKCAPQNIAVREENNPLERVCFVASDGTDSRKTNKWSCSCNAFDRTSLKWPSAFVSRSVLYQGHFEAFYLKWLEPCQSFAKFLTKFMFSSFPALENSMANFTQSLSLTPSPALSLETSASAIAESTSQSDFFSSSSSTYLSQDASSSISEFSLHHTVDIISRSKLAEQKRLLLFLKE